MSSSADRPPLIRLSLMMFLQYAIWGAWLPLFWGFMQLVRGFEDGEIGIMFGLGAAGALFAPLIGGQIADRYLNTERYLGISHCLGGALVWQLATLESYGALLAFCFFYSMIYAPTLSLTNSLALHHLKDADRDFGKVRVWGTIGWVAVGIGIGHWLLNRHTPVEGAPIPADMIAPLEAAMRARLEVADWSLGGATTWTAALAGDAAIIDQVQKMGIGDAFRLSGILGIVLGVFCFFLPKTPPQRGKEKLAFVAALREIRASRALRVIFLIGLPMSCLHQLYFAQTAPFLSHLKLESETIQAIFGAQGGGMMTIGQVAEIAVLALMPFALKSLPKKLIMTIGLSAFAVRFAIFAWMPEAGAVLPALALHGLCFGAFWFVCFLIVDEHTTSDVRASAQSLFNLVLIGIGMIVGNIVVGQLAAWAGSGLEAGQESVKWMRLFGAAAWATIACLVLFLVFYPKKAESAGESAS